jgi:hypothetical protein
MRSAASLICTLIASACLNNTSESLAQQRARAPISPTLQTTSDDSQKAQDLILSDGLYRVAQKGDGTLAFALVQMQRAKTPEDVSRIFQESIKNGQADPVFDRDAMVPLIKTGVKYFTKGPITDAAETLIDNLNDFTKELEHGQKTVQLSSLPPEYAATAFAGAVSGLSPEARARFTQVLAAYLNRDFDTVVRDVREKRLLSGPDSVDKKIYADQMRAINAKLDVEKQLLDAQLQGVKASQELLNRKAQLELDTQHLQAAATLAGLALGPVVGPETANKVTRVGQNFIQMNQAIKQFGPGGISPDKLLMFTNVVTAGIAIVGIIAASSQQDPTLVALQAIMQQLAAIKKQLDQIENKVDSLTDLVLVGFDKVLKGQEVLGNDIRDFRNIVTTQINDETQLQAIRVYLDYLDHGNTDYPLKLRCASSVSKKSDDAANECLGIFAEKLSDKKLFTDQPEQDTRPQVWASEWSNQILSHGPRPDNDSLIAVQQLSYPFFFASDPAAFRSTIARNHELIAAYSQTVVGISHPATLPNPEILARQLETYISAARLQPRQFQTKKAVDLTDQALNRIAQVDTLLATTLRDKNATDKLLTKLGEGLTDYQSKAQSVLDELNKDSYSEDRQKFNSKNTTTPGVITRCPGDGEPALPIPTGGLDSLVPQIFWIAQEMGLGTVGQCYQWEQADDVKKLGGDPAWFQIKFTLRAYFNPSPKLLDNRISSFELPSNARKFDQRQSLQITQRTLVTKNHYSTYWGTTASIWANAWTGTAVSGGEHDVYECFDVVNGRLPTLSAKCITDPKRWIPRDKFVAESVESLTDVDLKRTNEIVTRGVQTVLASVILNRSTIWDQYKLKTVETPDGLNKNLSSRSVTKSTFLADALREYTRSYLLAEGWMLTSFYHQNPTSTCLAALDAYSPIRVAKMVSDNILDKGPQPLGQKFKTAMDAAMKECSKHDLDPSLRRLRDQLTRLRATELAN